MKPIDAATQTTYVKDASYKFQKYSVEAVALGHMETNAMSKQAIIGTTAKPSCIWIPATPSLRRTPPLPPALSPPPAPTMATR